MQQPASLTDDQNKKTALILPQHNAASFSTKDEMGLQNAPGSQGEFALAHIRNTSEKDIAEIVRVHLCSFPGFFLSVLGKQFLEVLYASIQDDPGGMGCVFRQEDGRLVGFVCGSTKPQRFYSRLLRLRWWRFGSAALPALLAEPSILPRLLRAFLMPRQPMPAANCGTLLSIAVDPTVQSHGVGTALIQAFMEDAKRRGLAYINLTTDARNNHLVNTFYLNRGFHLHRTFTTPEGRMMNEYLYKLPEWVKKNN